MHLDVLIASIACENRMVLVIPQVVTLKYVGDSEGYKIMLHNDEWIANSMLCFVFHGIFHSPFSIFNQGQQAQMFWDLRIYSHSKVIKPHEGFQWMRIILLKWPDHKSHCDKLFFHWKVLFPLTMALLNHKDVHAWFRRVLHFIKSGYIIRIHIK